MTAGSLFDMTFTSLQSRAITTLNLALEAMDRSLAAAERTVV